MHGITPGVGGPAGGEGPDKNQLEQVLIQQGHEAQGKPQDTTQKKGANEQKEWGGRFSDDDGYQSDLFLSHVSKVSDRITTQRTQDPRIQQRITDDIMAQLTPRHESVEDAVRLSQQVSVIPDVNIPASTPQRREKRDAAIRSQGLIKEQSDALTTLMDKQPALKPALQSYISGLAHSMVVPKRAKSVSEQREALLKMGLTGRQLSTIEQTVHTMVKRDFTQTIKDSFTQFLIRYQPSVSTDLLIASKEYGALESMGLESGILNTLRSSKDIKAEVKAQLAPFFTELLDDTLIRVRSKSLKVSDLSKAMDQLNHLCSVLQYDASAYFRSLNAKMDQWGLQPFLAPPSQGFQQMDTDSGSNQRRQSDPIVSGIEGESPDLQQLQQWMIQALVAPHWIGQWELKFRLARLRKKLMASGQLTKDAHHLMGEKALEKAKTMMMDLLRESVEERASLPVLSGSEWSLVRKKMKRAITSLKQLDAVPSKADWHQMVTEINTVMFGLIRESFLSTVAQLEQQPQHVGLRKQAKELKTTLERLKKESHIMMDILPAHTSFIDSSQRVVESA